MSIVAFTYTYAPNSDEARNELRPSHVEFLQGLFDSGILRVSGPTGEGIAPGALLILEAEDRAAADAILDGDPFFKAGLVSRNSFEWKTYFGTERIAR
jgi:uncharacterized protein YciI